MVGRLLCTQETAGSIPVVSTWSHTCKQVHLMQDAVSSNGSMESLSKHDGKFSDSSGFDSRLPVIGGSEAYDRLI